MDITVVFPIIWAEFGPTFLERGTIARCMVEGAALLLSDLGVTWAVLSAAWFPGELAKPKSATARSVSPYALAFSNWN